ncbi:MAG: SDR family oxidoreductase [Deltaproteobacteria bacterium]|nr:SDR family oxidoreductase [Deltaproteobacteria bacterium]
MKSVLITGTSTGIGRATALHLDKLGYTVFAGVRKDEDAKALKREASENLVPLMIDMNDTDSMESAFKQVSKFTGSEGLAGLVNNAGIPMGGPLEFFNPDELQKGLQVNLLGHIRMIQLFLPLIRKRKGRIVNLGSIGGIFPAPFTAPYSASKAAMHALTHALRRELLPEGIHVVLIIPGNIKTSIWKKVQDGTKPASHSVEALYGSALRSMEKLTKEMGSQGIPPEGVAKIVEKALILKRPKPVYIVGTDAILQSIAAAVLPKRWIDRMLLFALGIRSSARK